MHMISFDSTVQSIMTLAATSAFTARSRYIFPFHIIGGLSIHDGASTYLVLPHGGQFVLQLQAVLTPRADLFVGEFLNAKSQPKPVFSADVLTVLANAMQHLEPVRGMGISCEFLCAGILDFVSDQRLGSGASYLECWRRMNTDQ